VRLRGAQGMLAAGYLKRVSTGRVEKAKREAFMFLQEGS